MTQNADVKPIQIGRFTVRGRGPCGSWDMLFRALDRDCWLYIYPHQKAVAVIPNDEGYAGEWIEWGHHPIGRARFIEKLGAEIAHEINEIVITAPLCDELPPNQDWRSLWSR